jgi:formylglycine-generating enzyme required for sulfatase activity
MRLKSLLFITLGLLLATACTNEDKPANTTKGDKATDFSIPAAPPVEPQMQHQKRFALVIGNSAYHQEDLVLDNPVNDAADLAKVLRQLGFEVVKKTNLSKREMETAIDQFSQKLDNNKGVGLFYFSGHGSQYKGVNYMLPVDVESLTGAWQLRHKTVSVDYILDGMKAAMNQVNIIILDACRDLPAFAKGDMMPGLSMEIPIPGSVIAYAAAPGGVAASGVGERNSPYVKHLMKWMQAPNLSIDEVFTKVGEAVKTETYGNQLPGYYKQLYKPFYFKQQKTSKIAQLLRVCQRHFKNGRLSGGSGTAWGCYQAVLEKDQTNAEALAGLEKVEKRYVDLIRSALKKKQVDLAERYLAGLRTVSLGSAQLPRLEAELSALKASQTPPPQPSPRDTFVAGKVFQDRLQDGSKGPEMVWIPAGSFKMGDVQGGGYDNEQPVHDVFIGRFAMGRYEVTFAEYDKFAEATGRDKPSDKGWGRGNRPVIYVSWYDATAYAEWLSQQTGQKYRLPTEAEWEYAARAGTDTKYWWGNTASHEYANYGVDSGWGGLAKGKDRWKYTAPVGSFAPNPFGIYDTVGNVWEWTCSEYENRYNGKENTCKNKATIKKDGENKSHFVLRGGSWGIGAGWTRTADRNGWQPTVRIRLVGFRLARIP